MQSIHHARIMRISNLVTRGAAPKAPKAASNASMSSGHSESEETDKVPMKKIAWTCPTPMGSKFVAQGDPTDFAVIAAAKPWDRRLVVFNDNFRDRNNGQAGSGNATVRPFFEQTPRRAVGLSTGWTPLAAFSIGQGPSLGSLEKECIDLSLDKVYLVAKESRAGGILFSCDRNPTELAMDFSPSVRYISDGLRTLPQRGSRLRFKTVAEVLEAERQLEARAPQPAAAPVAPASLKKLPINLDAAQLLGLSLALVRTETVSICHGDCLMYVYAPASVASPVAAPAPASAASSSKRAGKQPAAKQ